MLVAKLGEFGLIERFRKKIKTDSSVFRGSGDDCAVLKFDKERYQLFTCDTIAEGVDFTHRTDPYLAGRKALAVQLSDIASCAGIPRHCVVSLGFSHSCTVEYLDRLFKGMHELAKKYKVNIVGGDISRAKQLFISISLLGVVEKKFLVLRNGAKEGDIIFVSGFLGGSISGKHLKFTPRIKEARFLAENFKINAMIDISDGLAQDLGHILKQSRMGAVVYEKLIPLTKQARNLADALYSGEDFELLFTLPRKEAKRLLLKSKTFYPIGEIINQRYGLRLIDKKNRELTLQPKGFCHF